MKRILATITMVMTCLGCFAQATLVMAESQVNDSILIAKSDSVLSAESDSIFSISSDSVLLRNLMPVPQDSTLQTDLKPQSPGIQPEEKGRKAKRDWTTWTPDPQRALWLALVIPGGGQIYNRKYWKLPIVYGGFMGCIYALTWNNMMYKDYSQAYLDITDKDPGTNSFNKFLHLGNKINDSNKERYTTIFKSRKDKYRRWRDLSFFVMIGIYALSVIDAYVDAELSVFDISKDLSLKVQPTVIGNPTQPNPIYASSLGVNCSLNF